MTIDDTFPQLVAGSLRGIAEVKDYAIVEHTVHVIFDFGALNSFVEAQLDRIAALWRAYVPDAALALEPWNEDYRTRFPFTIEEARLGGRAVLAPGIVATVQGVENEDVVDPELTR